MSNRMKELKAMIEATLVEEGVARPYEFSVAHNAHQQVQFYVKGIRVKFQFACSPSGSPRASLNSCGNLRKAIRSASGHALSGAPHQRSVLHDGGVLPGQPHHVGAGRARVPKHPSSVPHVHFPRVCEA